MAHSNIVKPLDWTAWPMDGSRQFEGQNNQREFIARAILPWAGALFVMRKNGFYSLSGRNWHDPETFETEADAKAAGDKYYEGCILSALSIDIATLTASSSAKDAKIAELTEENERLRKERDAAYAKVTCMCGSYVSDHGMGDGHSPVSQYDYALELAEREIERLRGAIVRIVALEPDTQSWVDRIPETITDDTKLAGDMLLIAKAALRNTEAGR